MLVVTSGGFGLFAGFSFYNENEQFYNRVLMPCIHKVNPEIAHKLGVFAAKYSLFPRTHYKDPEVLHTKVWGIPFENPVGLAAGFDKDGEAVNSLHKVGFGFIEVGSVTPLPQPGNDKPRVFRLPEHLAVINRYGFNSEGHGAVYERLSTLKGDPNFRGVIGVNLGKNKTSPDPVQDYVLGIKKFAPLADYLVINISSPNTPGLRDWQRKDQLETLLRALVDARNNLSPRKPLLIKLSPDLTEEERRDIAEVLRKPQCRVDGLVISNTTIQRPGIESKSSEGNETGGLSGAPLRSSSTKLIADMYRLTNGELPIIGVGGVFSGKDAFEKVEAGASLVQLYTAFSYFGPPRITRVKKELEEYIRGYVIYMEPGCKRARCRDNSDINGSVTNGTEVIENVSSSNQGFIGLHIGAGKHSRWLHARYRRLCGNACREGVRLLREGKPALDVVEAVTKVLEDSPLTNAGRGSSLNLLGRVEGDASVMCGRTLHWAGVGAVPGVRNPIAVARALCDDVDREQLLGRITPCLLVGIGARRWAKERGLDVVSGKKLIAARSLKAYKKYKSRLQQLQGRLDTVGVTAIDSEGNVAAGCSSGGIALKVPGRVGQAAVYGSGAWAENGNPSVAVTTSGCGEHLVRASLARGVVTDVRGADCPTSALNTAMRVHFLESPYLRGIATPLGGLTYLQHSPEDGVGDFLWAHTTATMCVGFMSTGDRRPTATVSTLPPSFKPGHGVVVQGTCFRIKPALVQT